MTEWFEWREAPEGDFAVIGDPIAHSWSPRMFEAAKISNEYNAIRVPISEFDQAINRLVNAGYRGVNVTAPLKEVAFLWASEADDVTARIQAANTLCLLTNRATNTDHVGFMRALMANHMVNGVALVLGAGGSARAVLVALERLGFSIRLWNRTGSRAERLVSDLSLLCRVVEHCEAGDVNLVVNTTSASRNGGALPVTWGPTMGLAYDVVYGSEPTAFMTEARSAGWRACDGRQMLVEQAAESYYWWTGESLNKEAMAHALGDPS